MYTALITKIQTSPIEGADKIQKGDCSGYTVIVDKKVKDGTLGIFFPSDGQLSTILCKENKLFKKNPDGTTNPSGYLESNRRIRTIKLMGIPSEGIFLTLDSLGWIQESKVFVDSSNSINLETLKEGDTLTHYKGHMLCRKYVSKATREKRNTAKVLTLKQKVKRWVKEVFGSNDKKLFPQHFDTPKLRYVLPRLDLKTGTYVSITRKLHGTSARSGLIRDTSVKGEILRYFGIDRYKDIYGSRRLNLPHNSCRDLYREEAHNSFKHLLRKGEVVYYEIVGYGENGPIMHSHRIKDSSLKKRYGETMNYSYGMVPVEKGENPKYLKNFDIYVYRITIDGEDLDNTSLIKRCKDLNLKPVPMVDGFFWKDKLKNDFLSECSIYASQKNLIDYSHIHEGICVRFKDSTFDVTVKYKSWIFCDLEGIAKNEDSYIDVEEI